MKNFSLHITIGLIAALLTACSPNTKPRFEHEGKKEWQESVTPTDAGVQTNEFSAYDLKAGAATLTSASGNLIESLLQPLARFVLNAKFIEDPNYRKLPKTSQMLDMFYRGFEIELVRRPQNKNIEELKQAFLETVFAGCTRDLNPKLEADQCKNAEFFARNARHMRVMTLLAKELDTEIQGQQTQCKTKKIAVVECFASHPQLATALEERYRRLAMAVFQKSARSADSYFDFAYLKYGQLFSQWIDLQKDKTSIGYLTESHKQIFAVILPKYEPKSADDPEFRTFVENFNPWVYSKITNTALQQSTGRIFELATQCCLYTSSRKVELNPTVIAAIQDSQNQADLSPVADLTFLQMIQTIKSSPSAEMFSSLGINDILNRAGSFNSSFYNEYFFMIDRLYRKHITSSDVERMLLNTNSARTAAVLPQMVRDYLKINLVYLIYDTNRTMSKIYQEAPPDRIFTDSRIRSRELTDRWHLLQQQADLINTVAKGYFDLRGMGSKEMQTTNQLVRALNRNIHYLSVIPNMFVMTYYLSAAKNKIDLSAGNSLMPEQILQNFLDGNLPTPWFNFGQDNLFVDPLNLLFSFQYLLSTKTLVSFVPKDEVDSETSTDKTPSSARFYNLIFKKYLGDGISGLRTAVNDYERSVTTHTRLTEAIRVCDSEKTGKPLWGPTQINFLDLEYYTYTGFGDRGITGAIAKALTQAQSPVNLLQIDLSATSTSPGLEKSLSYRITNLKAMLSILRADLLRQKVITAENPTSADLKMGEDLINEAEQLKKTLEELFQIRRMRFFECAVKLQAIERERANRLYDEERKHLGEVFDKIAEIAKVTDAKQRQTQIDIVNKEFFKGSRIDQLEGLNYRMSKYDLLKRMQKRIESDIFIDRPGELTQRRPIRFVDPADIERHDMIMKKTAQTIFFDGPGEASRQDFIQQGLNLLNGNSSTPFISWSTERMADKSLITYLDVLQSFFFVGESVSAEELLEANLKVISSLTLSADDVKNMMAFGQDGIYKSEFFHDRLFERDGKTRLPFFYSLMKSSVEMLNPKNAKGGPIPIAIEMAANRNSLDALMFALSPDAVTLAIQNVYGVEATRILTKVKGLFKAIEGLSNKSELIKRYAPALNQPLLVPASEKMQATSPISWGSPFSLWSDRTQIETQKTRIYDFNQRTNNLYGTKEKLGDL